MRPPTASSGSSTAAGGTKPGKLMVALIMLVAIALAGISYAIVQYIGLQSKSNDSNGVTSNLLGQTEPVSPKNKSSSIDFANTQEQGTILSNTFDKSTDDWTFYSIYTHTTWQYTSAEDKFSMLLDQSNGNPKPSLELTGRAIDYAGCISKAVDVSELGFGNLVLSFDFESTRPSTPATSPTVLVVDDINGDILYKENIADYKSGWSHYQKDLTSAVSNFNTVRIALCMQDSDASNVSKSIWFDNVKLGTTFG